MFRLLPWSSAVGGNKVNAEEVKMLAAPQRRSPIVESPAIHKLKRKRANSGERGNSAPEHSQPSKIYARPHDTNGNDRKTIAPHSPSSAIKIESPKALSQCNSPSNNSLRTINQTTESGDEPPPANLAKPESTPPASTVPKMDTETLRRTLEAQLSLEILLKHDELRLIDQELAKCQVALDQLRRCSEIPYPGSTVSGLSYNVSNGTGNAILPAAAHGPPLISPSPWGVTDGPYSRHYARWLLPDPRFDGGEAETAVPTSAITGGTPTDGRVTRGSWSEQGVAGTLRSQRSSAGTKLQALSSGYPQPKDKAGPMIIKRKSDGQLVKLVCLDCRRENFSSTQGFINHCRIAHNRNFASHDAAAAASGEPVEVDESGAVIGNNNDVSAGTTVGYVHPLIRSAHLVGSTPQPGAPRTSSSQNQIARRSSASRTSPGGSIEPQKGSSPLQARNTPNGNRPRPQHVAVESPSPSFKASPETPNLSSLMKRRGMAVDLLDIVDDALTKIDLDMFSEDELSEAAETENEQPNPQFSVRGSRLPARTIVSPSQPPRPGSRKGADKPSRKPQLARPINPPSPQTSYRSPYGPASGSSHVREVDRQKSQGNDMDIIMADSISADLSPNTVESNQAPSLVSDDEDYEAPSESETPSPSPSMASDEGPDNIEVRDGDEGSVRGTNVTTAAASDTKPGPEIPSPSKHHPSPVPREVPTYKKKAPSKKKSGAKNAGQASSVTVPASATAPRTNDKEQKRVSFVSPITTPPRTKKDGTGKRHRRG
ncbi:ADA HAT complex component 1 [Blastomyces parvus]|uniref:ADA HAT complex component 1 n=1 Tax=Blastomyces parvus TaxID=2060905 RepID=A0A2B7XP57_9EURO|nr:ADA HAT complex component 1 [Blastomyces parvus]